MHLFRKTPFIKHALRALALCAVAGWLSGCATTYDVKVTALRSPEAAPCRTYRLVSAVEGRETYDPQYPSVAAVVEQALAAHGLFAASRPEWADIVVKVDFGVGPCRLKKTAEPGDGGASMIYYPDKSSGPISESTGTIVPASALKRVNVVWEKRLLVFARENTMGGNTGCDSGAELWRVEVAIEDSTQSFDELLPVLAGAMVDHIDTFTDTDCIERHK